MHPSLSVIFFTTASGAGYGLLAILGVLVGLGLLPEERSFVIAALALALAFVSAGLVSSTFHLGHPERAWRAFSQWRSSWLSREGVVSTLTFVPTAVFAAGWIWFGRTGGAWAVSGILMSISAVVSVICTAGIYF